jgi:hypothetical protein
MLRKAIPALLLLWCALSLGVETRKALEGWDRRATSPRAPDTWRFGNPPLDRLIACLDDARGRVPPGSVIAFAPPAQPERRESAAFFRTRWAAYLLPQHDVLPISDPGAPHVAEYVIDDRAGLDLPRLELIAQLRGCRLFKVRPLP